MSSQPPHLEKGLPSNPDAERTILGAVLLDNEAWPFVRQDLRPGDFSIESHRRIVLRMRDLAESDRPIDIVTLSNELGRHREVEAVGGVAYLASLTEGLPRRPAIAEYIRIVKDRAILRGLIGISEQAITQAADGSLEGIEVATSLMNEVQELVDPVTKDNRGAHIEEFIVPALQRINDEYMNRLAPCIPSGNPWFDHKTGGGYRLGKITIIAARPKVGKTGEALRSAAHNLKAGRKVVIFSLEMEKDEILRALVPHVVDVPSIVVQRPHTQNAAQNRLVNEAMDTIVEWPLWVYDGAMDCNEICWTIDKHTRKGEEVLFILDHFGLISSTEKKIRERYVDHSAKLRDKIKHKKAALLALFQLKPVPRDIADKRPISDDLKESGNPLEDCYAMLLLHRYRDTETNKITKKANLNLDLIRGGGFPGNIDCEFDTRRLCFEAEPDLMDDDNDYFPER